MIYFLIYLFLEIFVLVEIGSTIGPFWTFIEIVGSAFLGLFLLSNFRYTFFENVRSLVIGEITLDAFTKNNIATLIGAILLIVPGFLTDVIGILFQFSIFTDLIVSIFAKKKENIDIQSNRFQDKGECDVIDIEVIESHNSRK